MAVSLLGRVMVWARGLTLITVGALPALAAPPADAPQRETSREAAAIHHNRALAHLADGRTDEAAESFRSALEALSEPMPESRYNLALALHRARRFDEALEALQPLAREHPRARVLRARILRSAGRAEEALAAWSEAWKDGILDTPGLWHLGQLFQLAGRFQEAARLYTQLADQLTGPAAAAVAAEAAEASALGHQPDAAWAKLQAALILGGDDEELASILEELRRAREQGDETEIETVTSLIVNLLRATDEYRRAVDTLTASLARSSISDAPLPLPVDPRPGPPAAAYEVIATLSAPGDVTALCQVGEDLVALGPGGGRVFVRTAEGARFEPGPAVPGGLECAGTDLDHDGVSDLVIAGTEGTRVSWNDAGKQPSTFLTGPASELAVLDYDLDGDADLVTTHSTGVRLWRNNRDRTFSDVTSEAGLDRFFSDDSPLGAVGVDLDLDGTSEMLVAGTVRGHALGGLQQEEIHRLPMSLPPGPLAAADLDRDGWPDLITAGQLLLQSAAAFTPRPLVDLRSAARLGSADLDADGFPDLLVLDEGRRLKLLRGLGDGRFEAWPGGAFTGVRDAMVADVDGDLRLDLVLLRGSVVEVHASRSSGHPLAVSLRGTKDNPDALGSRVELWAGELFAQRQVRTGTHELGEQGSMRILGLGPRESGQWLRVTWPNDTWTSVEEPPAEALAVEQDPSLVGSCPFLFSWNGSGFGFVTDLLGGAPLGLPLSRDLDMPIDPDEYVLLGSDQLAPQDGAYELRITVELREILYLDHVELLVIDHPEGSSVATDDGLQPPPFAIFHLYAGSEARPPAVAVDHHGQDVRELLTRVDGRYPDAFEPSAYQGYAEPSAITLTFDPPASREEPFLLVRGGYFWSEADNLAISQAQTVAPRAPRLEMLVEGAWETLLDPMPFPGGRAKTVAIELGDQLPEGEIRLRISSNLRLYFDQILLATEDLPSSEVRVQRLPLAAADLRWRGYSEEGHFDGRLPPPFLYGRRSPGKPYPQIEGFFTRYGDVMPLLTGADDASVVLHHGDELALSFTAHEGPPPGFIRSFLVYTVGWDKDGDPNVETGAQAEPLPFRAMTSYPYEAPEAFPWTPELRRLDRQYRTRWISGSH